MIGRYSATRRMNVHGALDDRVRRLRRRTTMSIIDKALEANRDYAKNYNPTLGKHPAPKSLFRRAYPGGFQFRIFASPFRW
jgi:hypothetical protein